jgi:hypothetical protein
VRYLPEGFICDVAGSAIFPTQDVLHYLVAFLNTNIAFNVLQMMNPTLNFQAGNIAGLPMLKKVFLNAEIEKSTIQCIDISRDDWDAFETSWDFRKHPLWYREV